MGTKSLQTRQRILSAARTLFNEQGTEQVALRQVAQECGIAYGNLTYYYAGKNKLTLAVFKQFQAELDMALDPIRLQSDPVDQWKTGCAALLPILVDYQFLIRDLAVVFRLSAGVTVAFRQWYPTLVTGLANHLEAQQGQGLLALSTQNHTAVAHQLVQVATYLPVQAMLEEQGTLLDQINRQLQVVMLPYWTAKGKREFISS